MFAAPPLVILTLLDASCCDTLQDGVAPAGRRAGRSAEAGLANASEPQPLPDGTGGAGQDVVDGSKADADVDPETWLQDTESDSNGTKVTKASPTPMLPWETDGALHDENVQLITDDVEWLPDVDDTNSSTLVQERSRRSWCKS